ncbi:integrase catalytic domain-containing protein [Trichonephila clavipes]|nr:integrase catalytic domain-containing protein [Trichonephila clavipes]
MFDGLVAFAMDRWRHDCGARRVRIISRPGSPMSEGRFDLSTFRSERTNEASTLTITPKRSSSRDVALRKLLGVQKCRTTGYHPQANGMIEELHHPLKSAIKCHATERWTEVLPIILLGLRASLKEDILCTPAELVLGTTIRLPGEMFDSSKPDDDVVNFVSKLKSHMQSLHPKPPKHHGKRPVFIHPGLLEATHVFLRRDMLRRPLQQPYDGPFKVLQRKDKVFFLDINGKRVSISIDRCKPAFFLNTEDLQLSQTKNETPATVEPNATASTSATVESDPTASTPTQPSTLSGRKVHLPTSIGEKVDEIVESGASPPNFEKSPIWDVFACSVSELQPYHNTECEIQDGGRKIIKK